MKTIQVHEYTDFLKNIKDRIQIAQSTALQAVNKELMMLYWDIGRQIVKQQNIAQLGDSVKDSLLEIYGECVIYISYSDNPKLSPLVAEISWTHKILAFWLN